MPRTITELGPREVEFLARFSSGGQRFLETRDAERFWGDPQYTRDVLSRLVSKGWLERLARGKYMLIPLEAGVERVWSENTGAVAMVLEPEGALAYWSAIAFWGWTTQLPRAVTVATPRRRSDAHPEVLGVRYRFVYANPARWFGHVTTRAGTVIVRTTDKERTIIDMMDRPDLCGGIAEVAAALEAAWPEIDTGRLTEYVARFGSGTVPKRLGFLVESTGLGGESPEMLQEWQTLIGKGFSNLERGGRDVGPHRRRWNIRLNASGFVDPTGAP